MNDSEPFRQLREAVRRHPPVAALVLGSGLNSVTDDWPLVCAVPFAQIPGMPATTVAGHKGRLCLHKFDGQSVLVFQGRVHHYEGHPWDMVARPIHLVAELGVRTLLLTNASGGIGAAQDAGTLMGIRDHIAAQRPNWWRLPGPGQIDPPRPSPYSRRLRTALQDAAKAHGSTLPEGIYACVTGPNYETPAEIRALQAVGADAVGMSTVHEAETALSLGLEVAGVSCVANRAAGLSPTPLSHAEVLSMVAAAAGRMAALLRAFLRQANG